MEVGQGGDHSVKLILVGQVFRHSSVSYFAAAWNSCTVSETLPRETPQTNYACFSDTRLSARAVSLTSLTMLTDGLLRQRPSHLSDHLKVTAQAPYLFGRYLICNVHGHNPSVDIYCIPCFGPTGLRQQRKPLPLPTPSERSTFSICCASAALRAMVKKPDT